MKVTSTKHPAKASWIRELAHRLDAPPFVSGAMEARKTIDSLSARKDELRDLLSGATEGVFHAGRIARLWVKDLDHGTPFLSSTDILQADLSHLSLISNKVVRANPRLLIKSGWILISRSGTVGRTVYVRPEMDGLAATEDVLRVVPDPTRILPGYLFAFLSSRYGIPVVTSGTYGSIIQHLEPEHILPMRIPRFGKGLEQQVHDLVNEAAELRHKASEMIAEAKADLLSHLGAFMPAQFTERAMELTTAVNSHEVARNSRMEGYFYNPSAKHVDDWASAHERGHWTLGDIAQVFDVPPFKHIYVESDHGLPFFTSGDLFLLERKPRHYLSTTQTKGLEKYIIKKGWVLIARSGQLGGIIGRPQFADSSLDECTTSDHVIRIVSKAPNDVPPGFLFAYLDLREIGYPLITRTIAGKSVPALWPEYLKDIKVVKVSKTCRQRVHNTIASAFELRIDATRLEDSARLLVEDAIDGGD